MKKYLIIGGLVVVVAIACFYLIFIYGRMEFRWNKDTSKTYLSHVVRNKEDYSRDSTIIQKRLRRFLKEHQESFNVSNYDDSTKIIIDTILYNPTFNKIAVLVITKNPTSKQLLPDERYDWYYDESAYFGNLEKDSVTIMSLGPQFINAHDKQKISDHAREYYFRILATEKDTSGRYKYNCNINDTRFWTCPIWKEIDGIKQARIAFEKEKKEHPENIYEPKR